MAESNPIPTSHRFTNLTGQRFGKLRVLSFAKVNQAHQSQWNCLCDCGNEAVVGVGNLRNGSAQSCGCLRRMRTSEACKTHGMSKTNEYQIWKLMRSRCENPNNPSYRFYGAKGISVCARWQDFSNFFSDMGPRPSLKHSVDRRDGSKGYCKSNCRWATTIEQQRNKISNHLLTFHGKTKCVSEWSELLGFNNGLIQDRISRGWTLDRILTTPPRKFHWHTKEEQR